MRRVWSFSGDLYEGRIRTEVRAIGYMNKVEFLERIADIFRMYSKGLLSE